MLEKTQGKKVLKTCISIAFLFLFIFIFLSINYALSQEEQGYEISYAINITILHDNSINEEVGIKIRNNGDMSISELSYELPANASNVRIYEGREIANYSFENINGKKVASISLKNPIEKNEEKEIVVSFKLRNVVEVLGNDRIFSQIFRMPTTVKYFYLKIKLPPGMIIRKETPSSETANVAPLANSITTDGESIILSWRRENISKFSVFVRFSNPERGEVIDNVAKPKGKENLIFAFSILAIAFFAIFLYLRKRNLRKEEREFIHFLKEDEAKIIEIVKNNPGINQKRIAELANYSKSKISKVIAELEKRGIVRTEKTGRKVKVYLHEDFGKILKEEEK